MALQWPGWTEMALIQKKILDSPGTEAATSLGDWASKLPGTASSKLADMLVSMARFDLSHEHWPTVLAGCQFILEVGLQTILIYRSENQ